jgi:hypothetical protein
LNRGLTHNNNEVESANPAMSTRSCVTGAPATQQLKASFVLRCSGSSEVDTTSVTARRPKGKGAGGGRDRRRHLVGWWGGFQII